MGVTGVTERYQEKGFYGTAAESQITAPSMQSELRTRYEEVTDGNDQ